MIRPRRISSRSMIARLEGGDVLLTTRIKEVSVEVFEGIVAGNVVYGQLHAEDIPEPGLIAIGSE